MHIAPNICENWMCVKLYSRHWVVQIFSIYFWDCVNVIHQNATCVAFRIDIDEFPTF